MSEAIEKIIREVDVTMTMENMPLTEQDKNRIRDCLAGKVSFEEAIRKTVEKHTRKQ